MLDFAKSYKDILCDGVVTVLENGEGYLVTLQTQPAFIDAEENKIEDPYNGFTAVKKARLNLNLSNPLTQRAFKDKDDVIQFCDSNVSTIFMEWYDDPIEEESS